MVRRRRAHPSILSSLFLGVILGACAPDEADSDPVTGRDCESLLADWDAEQGAPDPDAVSVVLDSGALRDGMNGRSRPAIDGDPATVELVDVGQSLVVRLDQPYFVRGLRYTAAGQNAVTDYRIYLSPSTECWGEPVVEGRFDGTEAVEQVELGGRAARFVRFEVLGTADGSSRGAIGELSMVVGARVMSEPEPHAVVGIEWAYDLDVSLPGPGALGFELVTRPAGMTVDDAGIVRWTPAPGDEGTHDVVLRATRGPAELEQSFTVIVAGVRTVGSGSVPAGGGTVVVDTSMSGVGPATVEVTVDDPSAPAGTIDVMVVEGETADGPRELTPLGIPFIIDTDLPEGTVLHVRIDLRSIPGLPSTSPEDSVFVTAYPRNYLADGPGAVNRFGFWDIVKAPFVALWDLVAGDPEVFQINEGVSVVYRTDEFTITYMLDMGDSPETAMSHLMRIGDHVVASRDYFVGQGCNPRPNQPVIIHALAGPVGQVDQTALVLELDKMHVDGDPDESVRSTVAHELFHVYQIAALDGGFYPDAEFWWIEGTAAYMEDEVFDTNDWQSFYGPFDGTISRSALDDQATDYNSMVYWKSLKAQQGFNACDMITAYGSTGEGFAALSQVVGGDDVSLETFATYIAAWNHVRTADVLDDHDIFFMAGASEFVDPVSGNLGTDGYREYTWQKKTDSPAGGESARLTLEEEGTMEIEVRGPTSDYLLYVYDENHQRIGEIAAGDGMLSVEVSGEAVYFDMGIEQGTAGVDIDVFARIMATEQCASSGAPCGGSGSAFDEECCGDQICVVGACRPNTGGREQASCTDTLGCASGLICNEVGSEEAATTCCARDTDYCVGKEDCCGMMDCVDNRCIGRTSGEACLNGDCVGVSFCDGGTCT